MDDASSETASFEDVAGNDYDYWLDGSLKKDNNKDITQIDYNYLKLPKQIFLTGGRWIKYEYDANGTKLRKILSTGKVTDYEEDEIYEDGFLYQTSHDEGRIVNDVYEYNITDHLGNVRISFKDNAGNPEVTQINHVGAYGESLLSLSYVNTSKINNFTYSTYEKENDFGIGVFDAHARVYDPITPRFWQIDPLAEVSRRFSPYTYANNNPLRFIDPDGMLNADTQKGFNKNDDDIYVRDNPNMDKFNGIQGGDPPSASNVNTASSYDKLKNGTNVTSGIYAGTKLAEVTVKGTKSNAFSEAIGNFGSAGYNNRYFPHSTTDRNNYSPYNPDAVAFSMSFNASGYMWSGSIDIGFAMGSEGFAVFAGETYGVGGQMPGIGIGGSFSMIDKYGGQKSVFDGMAGESIGGEANAVFSGAYSTSARILDGVYRQAPKGVETISIGLRPSIGNWGVRGTYSNTKYIQPLWQR